MYKVCENYTSSRSLQREEAEVHTEKKDFTQKKKIFLLVMLDILYTGAIEYNGWEKLAVT